MNFRFNAKLHDYPPCPECNAMRAMACTTPGGIVRSPHRVRERVAAGEFVVIRVDDARKAKRVRALNELVAAIRGAV